MGNKGQIIIKVESCGDVIINLEVSDSIEENFILLMSACEYLINFTANRSNLEYSKAVELLVKGSKTYNNITITGSS